MSNMGRIAAYGRGVLLTIQSNAAWRQKVRLIGPGVNVLVVGSGENNILWQKWVSAGAWTIECWYERQPHGGGGSLGNDGTSGLRYAKDAKNWIPSKVKRYGIGQLGFDDGAGDGDFNDIMASATVVRKSTFEKMGELQSIMKGEEEASPKTLPQDSGIAIFENLD